VPLLIATISGVVAPIFIVWYLVGTVRKWQFPTDGPAGHVVAFVRDNAHLGTLALAAYFTFCLGALLVCGYLGNNRSESLLKTSIALLQSNPDDTPDHNTQFRRNLSYLLWPRPKEVIKWVITLYGMILGFSLSHTSQPLDGRLRVCIFVLLVFEFLSYNARYQWNDLRGMLEDRLSPLAAGRRRMPMDGKRGAAVQVLTATTRLALACGLACLDFGGTRAPLLVGIAVVFGVAVLYERARHAGARMRVYILVGMGYAIRLVVGLWCAWPTILTHLSTLRDRIFLLSVVGAFYTFGLVFVGLTWVQEGLYLQRRQEPMPAGHIGWLAGFVAGGGDSRFPLRRRGMVATPWNLAFVCTCWLIAGSLLLSIQLAPSRQLLTVLSISAATAGCALVVADVPGGGHPRIARVLWFIALLATNIGLDVWGISAGWRTTASILFLGNVASAGVYLAYRTIDYEALYTPWPPLLRAAMRRWARAIFSELICIVAGRDVWRRLSEEERDR